jgi:hypothetical protein
MLAESILLYEEASRKEIQAATRPELGCEFSFVAVGCARRTEVRAVKREPER